MYRGLIDCVGSSLTCSSPDTSATIEGSLTREVRVKYLLISYLSERTFQKCAVQSRGTKSQIFFFFFFLNFIWHEELITCKYVCFKLSRVRLRPFIIAGN